MSSTWQLPSIQRELGDGLAGQQWISNAYLLALASLLLVAARWAMCSASAGCSPWETGFGVMSVAGALAPSVEILIAARALQGVAGAVLVPSTLAVIVATFPESERGRAIGAWTAWTSTRHGRGTARGGQIVDAASWRWILAINVPLVWASSRSS